MLAMLLLATTHLNVSPMEFAMRQQQILENNVYVQVQRIMIQHQYHAVRFALFCYTIYFKQFFI
jgi:hypothetical protein